MEEISESNTNQTINVNELILKDTTYIHYLLFGVSFGLALASKISVAPLAVVLPVAAFIKLSKKQGFGNQIDRLKILKNLIFAGFAAFIVFRIFQP